TAFQVDMGQFDHQLVGLDIRGVQVFLQRRRLTLFPGLLKTLDDGLQPGQFTEKNLWISFVLGRHGHLPFCSSSTRTVSSHSLTPSSTRYTVRSVHRTCAPISAGP